MMRFVVLVLMMGVSSYVVAQGMPEGMQEAMDCMNSLDQDALEKFGEQAESIGNEIKALCDQGDESGARDVAMGYVKELVENEQLIKLKECSELMRKAMPSMPIPEIPTADMYEEEADSICENID